MCFNNLKHERYNNGDKYYNEYDNEIKSICTFSCSYLI